jgi:hypothetical protein
MEIHIPLWKLEKPSRTSNLPLLSYPDKSLVAQKGNNFFELHDKQLLKAWTGKAVIVTGEPTQETNSIPEPQPDFVIFAPERDTWESEHYGTKETAKVKIARVKDFPPALLPTHPVICLFHKPSKEFLKKHIRGMVAGCEICIYDPSDPVSEFLHELGHVWMKTRLNSDDIKDIKEIYDVMEKRTKVPAIFITKDSHCNWEESFCNAYMWYCKGILVHSGYGKILDSEWPQASKIIRDVMDRIDTAQKASQEQANRLQKSMAQWEHAERQISSWINQIQNKPSQINLSGKLVKAYIPTHEPKKLKFPEVIEHEEIAQAGERVWIRTKSGLLSDKIIVLKSGYLDVDYYKLKGSRSHLIPVQRSYINKNGKVFNRTVNVLHTEIKKEIKKAVEPEQKKATIIQKISEKVKDKFSEVMR